MALTFLQNRISKSRTLLPVMAVYAVAVWVSCGLLTQNLWLQFACFVVSSYLMVELNNSNALIRIYSRMVSCSFIVMMCMSTFLLQSAGAMFMSICMVTSFVTIFMTYQDNLSMGWIFYSFLSLGIASLVDVKIVYFAPALWIAMFFHLKSLTLRTFFASILGMLCPYWFLSLYLIYTADGTLAVEHFSRMVDFCKVADFSQVPNAALLSFGFVLALSVIGIVHYLRNRINDKTRTRMLYNTFILIDIVAIIFMILQPQSYATLLTVMIVTTSPLIAHFIALTHTKITNATFIAIVVVALVLTLTNILQLI